MIDKQFFDDYQSALSVNSDLVKAAVGELGALVSAGVTNSTKVELTREYAALVSRYGKYAATVALEFYETQRAGQSVKYEASIYEPENGGLLAWDVTEACAASTAESLIKDLQGRSIQRVNQYADETIWSNASKDPLKPRWALVPHAGACAYCRMIGGLGFQYKTQNTLGSARHKNCKCTPVCDFDADPSLLDYDPNKLAEDYNAAQFALFEGKDPYKIWDTLPDSVQNHYKQLASDGHGDFDRWRRNITLSYMETGKTPDYITDYIGE